MYLLGKHLTMLLNPPYNVLSKNIVKALVPDCEEGSKAFFNGMKSIREMRNLAAIIDIVGFDWLLLKQNRKLHIIYENSFRW